MPNSSEALKNELLNLTPEQLEARFEQQRKAYNGVPDTQGMTSEQLSELAAKQRKAVCRNSSFEVPQGAVNTYDGAAKTAGVATVVAAGAGVAVVGGLSAVCFGWLGKQFKQQNRRHRFNKGI